MAILFWNGYSPADADHAYFTTSGHGDVRQPVTEHQALMQLHDFFGFFDRVSQAILAASEPIHPDDQARLRTAIEESHRLRESLTFMGEKEMQQGVRALADYYHAYLKANPGANVVLHSCVSNLQHGGLYIKSDEYLARRIHQLLQAAEYQDIQAASRVFDHLDGYAASGLNGPVKVAVLDDWSISGHQIGTSITKAEQLVRMHAVPNAHIEVNLLVARESQIQNGIGTRADQKRTYPVKAAYRTRADDWHITGAHSTADYGFASVIGRMGSALMVRADAHSYARRMALPEVGLTNIVRAYNQCGE